MIICLSFQENLILTFIQFLLNLPEISEKHGGPFLLSCSHSLIPTGLLGLSWGEDTRDITSAP